MPRRERKGRKKQFSERIAAEEKSAAKWEARINEIREETEKWRLVNEKLDAEWKEWRKESEIAAKKSYERLQYEMGKLGNSYGEQVEAMFVNLSEKFNKLGHNFPLESRSSVVFKDKNGKHVAEVDRYLENGDTVMAVEVKAKVKKDDVDCLINRLGKLSGFMKGRGDMRRVLGAVAGGIVPEQLLGYAHNRGLYVLVQSGESVSIAPLPPGFVPNEW